MSQSSFATTPTIALDFGDGSWTVRFYLLVVPKYGSEVQLSEDLVKLSGLAGSISMQLNYNYAYSPNVNTLAMDFKV